MTVEEVLHYVIALPQQRGLLTYHTLKRQFQFDAALSLPPLPGSPCILRVVARQCAADDP
jgi:hypothetical protein